MKITLLVVGKTDGGYLSEGVKIYTDRLKHYTRFSLIEIQLPKSSRQLDPRQLKDIEGGLIIKQIADADAVVLLDEAGIEFTSADFAADLQKMMNSGTRHLIFVVGGAWGFSDEVYKTVKRRLALSKMTFSHQMVRLFFTEQLYRAFTILKNEPYHNG